MAIKDQVDAKSLPHFVWIFDAFINRGTQNNFRSWVSYKIEPKMYLDYAKRIQARRVALEVIEKLRREDPSVAQDWAGWRFDVVDAAGAIVLSTELDSAEGSAHPSRSHILQ